MISLLSWRSLILSVLYCSRSDWSPPKQVIACLALLYILAYFLIALLMEMDFILSQPFKFSLVEVDFWIYGKHISQIPFSIRPFIFSIIKVDLLPKLSLKPSKASFPWPLLRYILIVVCAINWCTIDKQCHRWWEVQVIHENWSKLHCKLNNPCWFV